MNYKRILDEMIIKKEQGIELMTLERFKPCADAEVMVCTHPQTELGSYHTHDFFEVNYVMNGSCVNLVEEQYIEMKKGDLIMLHPGAFHVLYAGEKCEVYNFLFSKEWIRRRCSSVDFSGEDGFFARANGENFYKFLFLPSTLKDSQLTLSADWLVSLNKSKDKLKNLLVESLALRLFASMVNLQAKGEVSEGTGESSQKLIALLSYLMSNYKTVTLDELSQKFFYSKTHICRLFLQNTGKTFVKTLTDIRLANAKNLLKTTDMTVENIAKEVGYDSNEYFQRMFKKNVGISPGEYKKQTKI
jgi:AraC-like DNA-binding protein